MSKKCLQCGLVNFSAAEECGRCRSVLTAVESIKTATLKSPRHSVARRVLICLAVCIAIIPAFYLSLLASARSLSYEQKSEVKEAIAVLKDKGFGDEAALLEGLAVFKADDNWLNASVAKEDAYAATNFPFEIVTLYPDFFAYPRDATERAAILLHESKHLAGNDEHDAYEFVWKHRRQLGWTKDKYGNSPVWRNIRRQTRDNVPALFVCDINEFNDCTELP